MNEVIEKIYLAGSKLKYRPLKELHEYLKQETPLLNDLGEAVKLFLDKYKQR